MKKIVINTCFGGFRLSPKAIKRYAELVGRECYFFNWVTMGTPEYVPIEDINTIESSVFVLAFDTPNPNEEVTNENYTKHRIDPQDRTDPTLIQVIEEFGSEANGGYASLKIVEIPDEVEWEIEEYDGNEWVSEKYRTWR